VRAAEAPPKARVAELAFLVAVEGDAEVLEVEDLLGRLAGQ